MRDIMKMVKTMNGSGLLIKSVTQTFANKTKE